MVDDKVRITFSCEENLRDKLTYQATKEGIPRSQLIVELLDNALGADEQAPMERGTAVNRLIFDMQKRVNELENWRREILDWTKSADVDTTELENTMASLLEEAVDEPLSGDTADMKSKIPSPKR
ncbi:MAG: hypothetical protein ACXAB7_17325 [Candidatus Kariarchaeaceae archaeon]|jgi:hypothetical protein